MDLTSVLISAAIEVHRDKGPGLFESIYQWCLEKELELRTLSFVSQKAVIVHYKGFTREEPLHFDILVEESVLVEAKSVAKVLPIHKAQLLSYMKLLNVPVGLLFNFNEIRLVDGVHPDFAWSKPLARTQTEETFLTEDNEGNEGSLGSATPIARTTLFALRFLP